MNERIKIRIAYAQPQRQFVQEIEFDRPVTVAEALKQSSVFEEFGELQLEEISVGIFSRSVSMDAELGDGDRVEIYRPLEVDPKEARRLRAEAKKRRAGK